MDTFDQKNAIQEIVDYWTKFKLEDTTRDVQLTERDVESLFQVLEGHFMLRKVEEAAGSEKGLLRCPQPQCGRLFDKPWSLERHQQTHDSSKRFSCTKCEKQFLSSAGLTRHLSKHLSPVSCSKCCRQFTTAQYLSQHLQTHHPKA